MRTNLRRYQLHRQPSNRLSLSLLPGAASIMKPKFARRPPADVIILSDFLWRDTSLRNSLHRRYRLSMPTNGPLSLLILCRLSFRCSVFSSTIPWSLPRRCFRLIGLCTRSRGLSINCHLVLFNPNLKEILWYLKN